MSDQREHDAGGAEGRDAAWRKFEDVWGQLKCSGGLEWEAEMTLEALACAALGSRLSTLIKPEHAPLLVIAWQIRRVRLAIDRLLEEWPR